MDQQLEGRRRGEMKALHFNGIISKDKTKERDKHGQEL